MSCKSLRYLQLRVINIIYELELYSYGCMLKIRQDIISFVQKQ